MSGRHNPSTWLCLHSHNKSWPCWNTGALLGSGPAWLLGPHMASCQAGHLLVLPPVNLVLLPHWRLRRLVHPWIGGSCGLHPSCSLRHLDWRALLFRSVRPLCGLSIHLIPLCRAASVVGCSCDGSSTPCYLKGRQLACISGNPKPRYLVWIWACMHIFIHIKMFIYCS